MKVVVKDIICLVNLPKNKNNENLSGIRPLIGLVLRRKKLSVEYKFGYQTQRNIEFNPLPFPSFGLQNYHQLLKYYKKFVLHILIYNLLAKISLYVTASLILIIRHIFEIPIRLLRPKIVYEICKLKYQVLNHLDHALRNIHKYKLEELYTRNFQDQLSQISLFFPSKKRYTKPPNMPSSFLVLPPSKVFETSIVFLQI